MTTRDIQVEQTVYSQHEGSMGERGEIVALENERWHESFIPEGFTLIHWEKVGEELCTPDEFMTWNEIIEREA